MQKKERPALKRLAVDCIVRCYGTSQRRACRIVRQHRSVCSTTARSRIPNCRCGVRGSAGTRVYRLYAEEGLQLSDAGDANTMRAGLTRPSMT